MKGRTYIKAGNCLLVFVLLLACSACNNEDDVLEIFNGKTWKLARLTTEGSGSQFYSDLWSSNDEEQSSREALAQDGYFTLSFSIAEIDGESSGSAEARGIRSSFTDATVNIDGKKHTLSISARVSGSETDKLAQAFMDGLQNVYKYEGDSRSLTLYFKDGNVTRVMGFSAQ